MTEAYVIDKKEFHKFLERLSEELFYCDVINVQYAEGVNRITKWIIDNHTPLEIYEFGARITFPS